jgi:hypothetical protein
VRAAELLTGEPFHAPRFFSMDDDAVIAVGRKHLTDP